MNRAFSVHTSVYIKIHIGLQHITRLQTVSSQAPQASMPAQQHRRPLCQALAPGDGMQQGLAQSVFVQDIPWRRRSLLESHAAGHTDLEAEEAFHVLDTRIIALENCMV